MKLLKTIRQFWLPLCLVVIMAICDPILAHANPIAYSSSFSLNDFEIVQHDHPEKTWDKVFFGSSIVIAAFDETQSTSGYINLGVDYGTISDLYQMLKQEYIDVGSEIIVGLNMLSFMDDLDTNPTYIWHKRWYEPYCYFERDRLQPLVTDTVNRLLRGGEYENTIQPRLERSLYSGTQTREELAETEQRSKERFANHPLERFEQNFADLQKLIDLCYTRGIRLRAIWMPWNSAIEFYAPNAEIMRRANGIFEAGGVEVFNWLDILPDDCFFDIGHLNTEIGRPKFTQIFDQYFAETEASAV